MSTSSSAESVRLNAVSLRKQAREAIRVRIVLGQIEPGDVVSVASVAAELGVSVTPVREAVMDLANAGMVEVIRNRGFRVPVLGEHDLDEIFRLRIMLEVPAMAEVAQVMKPEQCTSFRGLAEQLTEAASGGELTSFLELDRQFHLGLLGVLGNDRLVAIVGQLRDQARLRGLQRLAEHGELTAAGQEHLDIMDALASGDSERAAELTRIHLDHSRGVWARV